MRRDDILTALTALGAELAERGLVADLYVVGGAAITLVYDERRATKDIDAVFVPKGVLGGRSRRCRARSARRLAQRCGQGIPAGSGQIPDDHA